MGYYLIQPPAPKSNRVDEVIHAIAAFCEEHPDEEMPSDVTATDGGLWVSSKTGTPMFVPWKGKPGAP